MADYLDEMGHRCHERARLTYKLLTPTLEEGWIASVFDAGEPWTELDCNRTVLVCEGNVVGGKRRRHESGPCR
jgi:hypothetical protein